MNKRLYHYLGYRSIKGRTGDPWGMRGVQESMDWETFINLYGLQDDIPYNSAGVIYPEQAALGFINCLLYDNDYDHTLKMDELYDPEQLSTDLAWYFREIAVLKGFRDDLKTFMKKIARASNNDPDLDVDSIAEVSDMLVEIFTLAMKKAKQVEKQDQSDREGNRRSDPYYNG
jgi:hypothetical protein